MGFTPIFHCYHTAPMILINEKIAFCAVYVGMVLLVFVRDLYTLLNHLEASAKNFHLHRCLYHSCHTELASRVVM